MSRISLLPEKISDFSAFLGSGDLIFKNPFHLICFYLVPELIVLKIHIRSKISVGLTVFQHVRCGESDRAVADIVVFDKGSGCFVRGGIGDVLKILEGDFRAAEEIQKFQGIFFVPGVFRDRPSRRSRRWSPPSGSHIPGSGFLSGCRWPLRSR